MKKYYELWLPYFKQGSDLAHCLEECKNEPRPNAEAMLMHADSLEEAARMLKALAVYAVEHEMDIHADTHHIGIEMDEEIGNKLVEEGLLNFDPFEEEEWDEEDDFCEDGDFCEECNCEECLADRKLESEDN